MKKGRERENLIDPINIGRKNMSTHMWTFKDIIITKAMNGMVWKLEQQSTYNLKT